MFDDKNNIIIRVEYNNQENSKSLEESEKIQQAIEYLWRIQEDFKSERGKRYELHRTYIIKHSRFSLHGLAKVPLLPGNSSGSSPQVKRTLENYLNSKQTQIYKSYTAKEKSITRISKILSYARGISPFSK